MRNKDIRPAAYGLIALLFWLTVWEISAQLINIPLILPSALSVLKSLFRIITSPRFYKIVLLSFLRIVLGFMLGALLGTAISFLTHYLTPIRAIISPFMTVVRATPVASFIMVIWLMMGSSLAPTAITVLMVMPIVWQNLTNGFNAVSRELDEVCSVFEIGFTKRFLLLVLPTLIGYLIPALVSSAGLAWKAGIAAEIIAYTNNSIGKEIFNAKNYLESADMLAWTAIVVIISLIFERLISHVGRRFSEKDANT